MNNRLARLSAAISELARWFAGAGLLIMTLIISWQVFARYVLNASPAWAEQASLLLMIWYVMFAAAAGVREGFHIRIAVFEDAMPPHLRRYIQMLGHSVVGLFGVAMAIWGTELTVATWEHVIPTLGLPRGVAYIPFPIAGVLMLGFSVEQILARARGTEVRRLWN
jgi:TRAP-type C4-dicarboxylate transport system permease small subunit